MHDFADRVLSRPWVARVVLAAATAATALLALAIGGQVMLISDIGGGADRDTLSARQTRVVALVNAQAIALTTLAREPGQWSLRSGGLHVTVVSKGEASRDVVTPRLIRLTGDGPDSSESSLARRDNLPVILVRKPSDICPRLFSKGGLSRFVTGPMEYAIAPVKSDGGEWKPYDEGFSCDALQDAGDDVLFLRPSQAAGAGAR